MPHNTYKAGIRDFFPYVDYGISDSVELRDLVSIMTSENKNDHVQMADGSFINFLPTRKLKLTVDTEQLMNTHTIMPVQKSMIATEME